MGCGKGSAGKSPGNAWNTAPDVDRQTYQQVGYESNECYLARAGNPGNEQADVGPAPAAKIENISIPVKCDLTVDTQLKGTPGTPADVRFMWLFPPNGTTYADLQAEQQGNGYGAPGTLQLNNGRITGAFDQYGVGKTFKLVIVMYTVSGSTWTELDRQPYTLTPVECKPGSGIKFIHPLPGSVMTSKCSPNRVHPVTGEARPHKGCDFAYGDRHLGNVLAASDGEVVFAGEQNGYGNLVIIGHSDSAGKKVCMTKYAHLSQIGVRNGQKVAAGDKIGIEGNTGIGTGAHLHFEIRGGSGKGDIVYDPALYITGTLALGADGAATATDPSNVPPPSERTAVTNSNVAVTAQGNEMKKDCNYEPSRVPLEKNDPPPDNAAIPPAASVPGDKYDKAFQLTMTEEIGGWFNSADPETIAGGDATTHIATTSQQKKKCGWVNHPKDPGGLTKYGVAQQSHKDINVDSCTLDQAKGLYKKNYWDKNLCDSLGNKACAVWFDATVQHGGCRKIFADAVGMARGSSMADMMTKAAAMPEAEFMDKFTTARLNYVSGLQVAKDMPGVTARPKRVRGKADAL